MASPRKVTLRQRPQQDINEIPTNTKHVDDWKNAQASAGQNEESWLSSLSLGVVAVGLWAGLAVQIFTLFSMNSTVPSDHSSIDKPIVQPKVSYPIILLGFPKSGSLALHKFFECHGEISSSHYCCGEPIDEQHELRTKFPCHLEGNTNSRTCGDCVLENLKAHEPAFQGCRQTPTEQTPIAWSQFDVETSNAWFLPQHFSLGLLHEAYPDATWILNTRSNARDWAESIYHWQSATRRILTTFGLPIYDNSSGIIPSEPPPVKANFSEGDIRLDMRHQLRHRIYNLTGPARHISWLEQIYENHTATVQLWARQFPSHRLVHINVDESEDQVLQTLDNLFGYDSTGHGRGHNNPARSIKKCRWNFKSPNEDWKDFRFPF